MAEGWGGVEYEDLPASIKAREAPHTDAMDELPNELPSTQA